MNGIIELPLDLLLKYEMADIKVYKEGLGDNFQTEKMFYTTFLMQTDHIPNKIIEKQISGETPEDYSEILNYRQFCRDKINELNALIKEEEEAKK